MITLYDSPASGNAYKVRLFLSLLGIEHESITVDLNAGDNRTPEFLARNPRGQIPVLVDGDTVVWDSQAILIYLARRYAGEEWLPLAPAAMAGVAQWLAVSENELLFGLARARAVKKFGRDFDFEACRKFGLGGVRILNAGLEGRKWLVGSRPTIADVACYPYVALAHEGGLSIDDQPNVPGWIRRVQALPGYTGMEGIAGHG